MSTPGVSLFQGAESIKVNTTLERAEEEEALEDQRRRNEELGNLLQNAFDDLDDDETTIDSTTNFQSDLMEPTNQHHRQQQQQQLHHQQQQQQREQQEHLQQVQMNVHDYEEEIEKLKILLDSRAHELDNIKQMANDEFKKRDELQKRLMITEAELDRALASKGNTHELLVESKEKCSRLEDTIDKMRAEKKSLEAENNTLLGKLETAQTLLADVQRKYDMVERDLNKHSERHAEVRRKQMEDRHRAEVDMMQQQMDQLIDKLDKKTQECENMSTRYQALQSSHELMLVDKAAKINDLSRALDDAQKQCEELLARPDYHLENMRLQKLVAGLQEQIAGMEKTIGQLTERLEYTTAELDVMDSVLHQHNLEDTPKMQGRVVGSTPLSTNDRIGNLKDELFRALANVKSKREEVRRLEKLLEEKNGELRELRREENKSLVQITTLKEDKLRLENRLKLLEEEQNDTKVGGDEQMAALRDQLQSVQSQALLWQEERKELQQAKLELEEEARKVSEQLRHLQVDFEELKQECDNLRRTHDDLQHSNLQLKNRMASDNTRLELERHKFLLKDSQAECDRLKNLYVEISNVKEAVAYELKKIRESDTQCEVQQLREKVANLQRALQLAEVKAAELTKLLDGEKLRHEQDVQNLKERLEKERSMLVKQAVKDSSNNCSKCIDYITELSKCEIQNLKLSNVNAISKQEIDDLQEQLKESQSQIEQLEQKLRLSEDQEQQIIALKSKAHQFEEYIKTHSGSPTSASEPSPVADKQPSHELLKAAEIKRLEARMREEMAKVFAAELKRMQTHLRQTEDRFMCVQREYEHVNGDLQQRQTEVNLLKQAILAEREKISEILKQKDTDYATLTQQLQKVRDELHDKGKRIAELSRELDERQAQIEAERQSMKAVMQQWEQQRKSVDDIEKEWRSKMQELRETHDKQMEAWQTKYNSAKRTAANYKRYAEDKETHMLKEYDRIKLEYESSLLKIELRMKETIEKKNREIREASAKNRDMGHDKENQPRN